MTFNLRSKLVKIGNSRGIRIPKAVVDQLGLEGEVELIVEENHLIVRAVQDARHGWEEAFASMSQAGDDALLDETVPTQFDEQEWEW